MVYCDLRCDFSGRVLAVSLSGGDNMKQKDSARRLTGDQRLAMAVILQAVEDARNPSVDLFTKLEATEFLGGERSEIWCKLAGLDPRTLGGTTREFKV